MVDPKFEYGPLQPAPTICDRCGKPLDEHPYVCPNGDGPKVVISADGPRHPKWQRVEPGTIIPAGQPYRIEYPHRDGPGEVKAQDHLPNRDSITVFQGQVRTEWFVDSSWKPPLVLPAEPTWGIAVSASGRAIGKQWCRDGLFLNARDGSGYSWSVDNVVAFIPLTDEQVARIEQAR